MTSSIATILFRKPDAPIGPIILVYFPSVLAAPSAAGRPRRTEPVTARDLGKGLSSHGPVTTDGPADRHHGVHAVVLGQADDRAHLVLNQEMVRRQAGPEAERTAGEDHVLNGRIDAGGGDVHEVGAHERLDLAWDRVWQDARVHSHTRQEDHRRVAHVLV